MDTFLYSITDDLEKNYKIIEKYGPYGEGNQKVSFKVKNFELTEVEQRDGSLSAISFMGGGKYTKLYGQNGIAAFGEKETVKEEKTVAQVE
mgnify:CR=1 FL=1